MVQAVGQLEAPAFPGVGRTPPRTDERNRLNGARRERTNGSKRERAADPVSCAILTPSGSLLARGRVTDHSADRAAARGAAAYALRLTDVAPRGALEALFHADQPEVVLRSPRQAELALRIDHITGPPAGRTYWLEPLGR